MEQCSALSRQDVPCSPAGTPPSAGSYLRDTSRTCLADTSPSRPQSPRAGGVPRVLRLLLLRAARLHPLRDRAALLLGDEADVEVVHLRV